MRPLSVYARNAALGLQAALIAGLWAWCGWIVGAIIVAPLFAPLPGLLRSRRYTAGWCSMLLLFYIAGLLAEGAAMHPRRALAFGLAGLACADFVAVMLLARLRAREGAPAKG